MMQSVDYVARLAALRAELKRRGLDGFLVPHTDEFLSEYVGGYARRLAWLSGFQGSVGAAVVLETCAAIFVDGRYTLQVQKQVDQRHWSCHSVPETSSTAWFAEKGRAGSRIGYDPWLHTTCWVAAARAAALACGAELVSVDSNPIDAVWLDRPTPSDARARVHPIELAGCSSADKRRQIADWLSTQGADAVVLSALDSVAWTFNIRGRDIEHTPVVFAYAAVRADATADLFIDPEKLTAQVIDHLGPDVRRHARDDFGSYLRALDRRRIAIDPERAVAAIVQALETGGTTVSLTRDPVVLPKAIKNPIEIAGHKAAQARDGAAMTRFLHWLSTSAANSDLTEISAAARLQIFREDTRQLEDLSFDTVSAFGPNGAIVHYCASEATNLAIRDGSLYLVDSGGQYLDGTTDVTRTVAIGAPTNEMRDRFTRVLKGHIALATATFPAGTTGGQLDCLARLELWRVGLDYAHGTGHGVGAYLGVHEGPQRIAHTGDCSEPLAPGMIVSNEPGYYKANAYGIRVENLLLVVKRDLPGTETELLGFETLTFVPIDRTLIDTAMLTLAERAWIDSYHSNVAAVVGPQLDGDAKTWLIAATRRISAELDPRKP
jgi:Xaa-Pro aminopeptidase